MNRKHELLNKYIDGELKEFEKKELKDLLKQDENLHKELKDLNNLKEVIDMLEPKNPNKEWQEYWEHIYNRIERGIGWIITSIGAILFLVYVGFQLIKDLIHDPELALYAKIGILSLMVGLIILFVSVLRERIFLSKSDKYSKEVKR